MTVNLAPIVEILLGLASTAVTTAIPILVPYILNRLHIANDADLIGKVDMAATSAAGAAYKFAAAHEGGLSNIAVHDASLATGVNYVLASMPDTLKQLGITPDRVREMVSARLGTLLASDPTVSATTSGTPALSPASAGPTPANAPVATATGSPAA